MLSAPAANKPGKARLARLADALVRQGFSVDILKERLDEPLLAVRSAVASHAIHAPQLAKLTASAEEFERQIVRVRTSACGL